MEGARARGLRLLVAALLLAAAPAPVPGASPARRLPRSVDLAQGAHAQGAPLPPGLKPRHYALTLRPYLDNGRFQGRVRINVTCVAASRAVFLHAHETLHIAHDDVRVWLLPDDGSRELLAVASTKKDSIKQHYVIFLTQNLTEGARYEVQLSFSGQLARGRPEGFFSDSYELHRTKERRPFAATQMRPGHARRVFPCFDEPQFKASFDISVVRPARMAALSNMPVRLTDKMPNEPAWQVDHFQTTPPMATLSLAVVVSDLGYISPPGPAASSGGAEEGPRVRVFGRAHLLGRLQDAADAAPAALAFLQDYFAAPFPLPKLDLVVLPHFAAPAPADMWGVVLFREEDLVGDATPLHLATELAYQWLGHLATPVARWPALHLNRALVGFLQAARLQGSAPDFSTGAAAIKDHSLYYEYSKRHPYALVQAQKETIRVMKTQWVLRMLNYTLTERTFREGLRDFLRDKSGGVWEEADVWEALGRRGWQDGNLPRSVQLQAAAHSWLHRDRFPALSVARDYAEGTAEVEQHVFLRERPRPAADRGLLWYVPVPLLTQDAPQPQALRTAAWLREQRSVTVRGLPGPERFIIVNPNEIGMFLVNYDATNWRLLSDFLLRPAAARQLDTGTRAKLLHDAWNLALGGELRPGVALNLTLALRHETEFAVWDAFFGMADHLGRQVRGTRAGDKFQAYVCLLTEPLVERLRPRPGAPEPRDEGAQTRADPEVSLRALARFAACTAGCAGCRAQAQAEFQRWLDLPDPEEGNPVSDIFLCPVLAHGPADQWEFVMQRLLNFPEEREREERAMLLAKLAECTKAPARVHRLLSAALLEPNSNFSDADVRHLFNSLSGNGAAMPTLFGFFVEHWDRVKERCRGRPGLWEYLVSRALKFKTQQGLDLVSELFVSRSGQFGAAEAVVEEALRTIKEEAQWSAQNLPEMESWLDAHLPAPEAPSTTPGPGAEAETDASSSPEPPSTTPPAPDAYE